MASTRPIYQRTKSLFLTSNLFGNSTLCGSVTILLGRDPKPLAAVLALPRPFRSAIWFTLQETTFNRDEVIATCFNLGLSYGKILAFLSCSHGVALSLRQLKRVLKSKGLCRRKNYSSLQEVVHAVKKEISGSGNSIGYRQMHQRLITDQCLLVKRETVRIILKRLLMRSRRAFRRRVY